MENYAPWWTKLNQVGEELTAQVLLSLKMGALCSADTSDTSECRLLSSSSF